MVIFELAEAKFWNSSSSQISVVLGFKVVWPWWPPRPHKGPREFFQKLHFRNQCIPTKKIWYVTALSEKFYLNLSTEEGCHVNCFQQLGQILYEIVLDESAKNYNLGLIAKAKTDCLKSWHWCFGCIGRLFATDSPKSIKKSRIKRNKKKCEIRSKEIVSQDYFDYWGRV